MENNIGNNTFKVFSIFDCEIIHTVHDTFQYNSLWRQNLMGCQILMILKDIYKFNISFTKPTKRSNWINGKAKKFLYNKSIDIYAFPMTLGKNDWDEVFPIQSILNWKFGFLIRRIDKEVFRRYYKEPFATDVWNVLYSMVIVVPLLFYVQSMWESKIFGVHGECSFGYELMIAIGGYCQNFPSSDPKLFSRRISYAVFCLFSYVIHNFFNSELLSHLVYKTDDVYDLQSLVDNGFNFAILPDMEVIFSQSVIDGRNFSLVKSRLRRATKLNASEGLQAIAMSRTALLSDYFSLYPLMRTMFNTEILCKLTEVDISSNVQKYFFTSKNFPYKEELKISILRVKEAGLISRLVIDDIWQTTLCSTTAEVQATFTQIFYPFTCLICSCFLSTIIMVVERWWYYKKNPIWPYID